MEFLRSTNNQHVGVNLKSSRHNYDGCLLLLYFFRVTVSGAPGGQKLLLDGIKPSCMKSRIYSVLSGLFWSTIAKLCYRLSHAVYLVEC